MSQSDLPFVVDSWNNRQGLPQSSVISVIQTRDGYLWLGTLNGLVRFDGIHFTIFDENNTPGLPSSRIVYLFEDSQTNLWAGTETAGIAMISNGRVRNFSKETSGSNRKVLSAEEDSSGTIWFNTEAGLLRFQDGKMDFFAGVWRRALGAIQKWQASAKFSGSLPWNPAMVKASVLDNSGNLVIATADAGIFWSDTNGNFLNISTNQGLSSSIVLSLCMDSQGNLWAGTDGGGLDRIKPKHFNEPTGLRPLVAKSVSKSLDGDLWAAFNLRGVSRWRTNSVQDFPIGNYSDAWTILAARDGTVWAGTRYEGLFVFQTNQFVSTTGSVGLGAQINALFEDRDGKIWAGTQNGLANFDDQNWKLFTTANGLSQNAVRAIAQDTNGDLWIGTESGGLNEFTAGKFSKITTPFGDDITCLYAGTNGELWVGTYDHGLAQLRNGKWSHFSTTNGLASDSISYIVEDGGELWVGSNLGLMRIAKNSLNNFADGKANLIFCRTYGENDGLPTRECSGGSQPAAILAADGKLFFSTTKGVVSVNPAELKPNSQPPQIYIESVLVDGVEQKTNALNSVWSQAIVAPPGYEQMEIDFTALNFTAPELVRFKYRLEGRETAWTDAKNSRAAFYPKLPPGNYQFHIMAENEDGVWNETGSVLEITVQPYFWQTKSFLIAAIIFALAIVAGVVRYISTQRLYRELQSLKQREALEHERARIARDLHDQLGANLTQVALLGEMAEADKNSPEEIESHAKQITETARETTHSLDQIVWAINPSNDTLEGLANYACKYAQEYLALAGLRYRADLPAQLPATQIPPEVRHNVFLAFKEAVHNVVKHAQATEVWIRLRLQPQNFILEIEDDGKGFSNSDEKQNRNGLRNMKRRMEEVHGEFSISARKNGGTLVKLIAPIS